MEKHLENVSERFVRGDFSPSSSLTREIDIGERRGTLGEGLALLVPLVYGNMMRAVLQGCRALQTTISTLGILLEV